MYLGLCVGMRLPHLRVNVGRYATLTLSCLAVGLGFASVAAADNPRSAARKEFLEVAQLAPDVQRGARLFETCAACHGQAGRGTNDGDIPAIAGQHGSVLLKQLVDFRHDGRWDERMQHFTDQHHLPFPQDLADVAAYAASLPRFPPAPGSAGDGRNLDQGARIYLQKCRACHGPLGQGDVLRLRPRLAGQHYAYLLRQLTETAAARRPGMDAAHVARLRQLSSDQLQGIADYLSRVSPDLASQRQR